MAEPKHVRAKSRDEWRSWLEKNHSSAESVIVVYARKGSGKPSVTYDESVEEALCYGWIDGVRGKLDETHFTVRFTPRKAKSIWSKINLERVAQLTKSGKMHASGKAAFELGKSSGRHAKAYAIRDAVAMPSELRAALAGDRRGRAAFEALSPGQKKGWMRSVSWGTQNEATRKQRARDALLLILAGRKSGETDAQAARRGIASKAKILGRS